MKFQDPVFEGIFKKRYKRFFADIELQGQPHVAHVANTGSMKGLLTQDCACRVTLSADPKRKLKHTLQMLKTDSSWVGINTHLPNLLVLEAWSEKRIPHWLGFEEIKKEYKLSKETRLDFALFKDGKPVHFVEVKNVTLASDDVALFPDAKTERGQKHLRELMDLQKQGYTTEMLYVVQRTDCQTFSPAAAIDPEYARLLKQAYEQGVRVTIYPVEFSADEVKLKTEEPLALRF